MYWIIMYVFQLYHEVVVIPSSIITTQHQLSDIWKCVQWLECSENFQCGKTEVEVTLTHRAPSVTPSLFLSPRIPSSDTAMLITTCIRLPYRLDMLIICWVIASVVPWLSWVTRQESVPQSHTSPTWEDFWSHSLKCPPIKRLIIQHWFHRSPL